MDGYNLSIIFMLYGFVFEWKFQRKHVLNTTEFIYFVMKKIKLNTYCLSCSYLTT